MRAAVLVVLVDDRSHALDDARGRAAGAGRGVVLEDHAGDDVHRLEDAAVALSRALDHRLGHGVDLDCACDLGLLDVLHTVFEKSVGNLDVRASQRHQDLADDVLPGAFAEVSPRDCGCDHVPHEADGPGGPHTRERLRLLGGQEDPPAQAAALLLHLHLRVRGERLGVDDEHVLGIVLERLDDGRIVAAIDNAHTLLVKHLLEGLCNLPLVGLVLVVEDHDGLVVGLDAGLPHLRDLLRRRTHEHDILDHDDL